MLFSRELNARIAKYRDLYLLFFPVLLYYLLFHYVPIYGVIIAFKDFNPIKGIVGSDWVGLKYFEDVVTDKYFWRVITNTLILSLYRIVFAFPIPIIIAILLNEIKNIKYKKTVQTIIYLPHFVSWVIYGGIVTSFLSLQTGVINRVLTALFDIDPIFFLAKPSFFRPILVISHILKESGWVSIIYIAAITGISPELYEAAIIDGANRFKQTLHVTLPGISSTIVVMLILSVSNILSAGFQQVVVLYNPLVYDVGDIIDTYVFRAGIKQGRFSYTAAVGFFKSIVALVLILSCDRISKKVTDQGII